MPSRDSLAMVSRHRAIGVVIALAAILGGGIIAGALRIWQPGSDAPATRAQLATLTEHGVRVEIALERDALGRAVLAGTYTPAEADMHLYSTDLPRDGIAGLGRPTRLDVPEQLAPGEVVADQPVVLDEIAELGVALPVYPDGAVTLRVPIAPASGRAGGAVTLHMSYMACSSKGYCLPPVVDQPIPITLPQM